MHDPYLCIYSISVLWCPVPAVFLRFRRAFLVNDLISLILISAIYVHPLYVSIVDLFPLFGGVSVLVLVHHSHLDI